jgi:hypothetical protein
MNPAVVDHIVGRGPDATGGFEAARKPERQPGVGEASLHPQRQELPPRTIEIIRRDLGHGMGHACLPRQPPRHIRKRRQVLSKLEYLALSLRTEIGLVPFNQRLVETITAHTEDLALSSVDP